MGTNIGKIIKDMADSGKLNDAIDVVTQGGSIGDVINVATDGESIGDLIKKVARNKQKNEPVTDDEDIVEEDEDVVDDEDGYTDDEADDEADNEAVDDEDTDGEEADDEDDDKPTAGGCQKAGSGLGAILGKLLKNINLGDVLKALIGLLIARKATEKDED